MDVQPAITEVLERESPSLDTPEPGEQPEPASTSWATRSVRRLVGLVLKGEARANSVHPDLIPRMMVLFGIAREAISAESHPSDSPHDARNALLRSTRGRHPEIQENNALRICLNWARRHPHLKTPEELTWSFLAHLEVPKRALISEARKHPELGDIDNIIPKPTRRGKRRDVRPVPTQSVFLREGELPAQSSLLKAKGEIELPAILILHLADGSKVSLDISAERAKDLEIDLQVLINRKDIRDALQRNMSAKGIPRAGGGIRIRAARLLARKEYQRLRGTIPEAREIDEKQIVNIELRLSTYRIHHLQTITQLRKISTKDLGSALRHPGEIQRLKLKKTGAEFDELVVAREYLKRLLNSKNETEEVEWSGLPEAIGIVVNSAQGVDQSILLGLIVQICSHSQVSDGQENFAPGSHPAFPFLDIVIETYLNWSNANPPVELRLLRGISGADGAVTRYEEWLAEKPLTYRRDVLKELIRINSASPTGKKPRDISRVLTPEESARLLDSADDDDEFTPDEKAEMWYNTRPERPPAKDAEKLRFLDFALDHCDSGYQRQVIPFIPALELNKNSFVSWMNKRIENKHFPDALVGALWNMLPELFQPDETQSLWDGVTSTVWLTFFQQSEIAPQILKQTQQGWPVIPQGIPGMLNRSTIRESHELLPTVVEVLLCARGHSGIAALDQVGLYFLQYSGLNEEPRTKRRIFQQLIHRAAQGERWIPHCAQLMDAWLPAPAVFRSRRKGWEKVLSTTKFRRQRRAQPDTSSPSLARYWEETTQRNGEAPETLHQALREPDQRNLLWTMLETLEGPEDPLLPSVIKPPDQQDFSQTITYPFLVVPKEAGKPIPEKQATTDEETPDQTNTSEKRERDPAPTVQRRKKRIRRHPKKPRRTRADTRGAVSAATMLFDERRQEREKRRAKLEEEVNVYFRHFISNSLSLRPDEELTIRSLDTIIDPLEPKPEELIKFNDTRRKINLVMQALLDIGCELLTFDYNSVKPEESNCDIINIGTNTAMRFTFETAGKLNTKALVTHGEIASRRVSAHVEFDLERKGWALEIPKEKRGNKADLYYYYRLACELRKDTLPLDKFFPFYIMPLGRKIEDVGKEVSAFRTDNLRQYLREDEVPEENIEDSIRELKELFCYSESQKCYIFLDMTKKIFTSGTIKKSQIKYYVNDALKLVKLEMPAPADGSMPFWLAAIRGDDGQQGLFFVTELPAEWIVEHATQLESLVTKISFYMAIQGEPNQTGRSKFNEPSVMIARARQFLSSER